MFPRFGSLAVITPYGLMLVIALLGCWYYARRRAPQFGVDATHIDLAVPLVFAVSVLGSQLLTIFNPHQAAVNGGLAAAQMRFSLFGLLMFALPALYLYSRLSGLKFRNLLDLFALPALVCLMLVRLGCFMAGCCWGDLILPPPQSANVSGPAATQVFTLPWLATGNTLTAVGFPAASFAYQQQRALGLIEPGASGSLPVHPTQLYEFILLAALLVVLRRLEGSWTTSGASMLAALGSYALLRFFIEFLRADNPLVLGRLSLVQLICVAVFIFCATRMAALRRRAFSG